MTVSRATHLGPYEILSPLGSGGMGEVYRARDAQLGREVAIKVLRRPSRADPDRLKRFEPRPGPPRRSIIPTSSRSTRSASDDGSPTS